MDARTMRVPLHDTPTSTKEDPEKWEKMRIAMGPWRKARANMPKYRPPFSRKGAERC